MHDVARLAARRLGVPDRGVRALARASRRRGSTARSRRATLCGASSRRRSCRPATARCRCVNAAHREPSRLPELDALADAFLTNARRQPRQPQQGRTLLATRGADLAVAGAGRAADAGAARRARTSAPLSGAVFRALGVPLETTQRVVLFVRRARRAVRGRAPRRRRQLRGAAAAVGVRRLARRRRWRAARDARARRPGADRAAHRPAAGARTTGSTRGCFNPEARTARCTTCPRPRPPHHARAIRTARARSTSAPAPLARDFHARAFTVGIGGPVGSGKTALLLALCRALRDDYNLAVVTNDIFTREDAEFLIRHQALRARAHRRGRDRRLPAHRGPRRHQPEPGRARAADGRVPARAAVRRERRRQPGRAVQPRAGRLHDLRHRRRRAATRSRARAGPGITQSDLLVINKTDLAPLVGADLGVMERDARKMRGDRAVPVRAGDARHRHPRDRAAHPGGARRGAQGGAGVG